jgi:hypothetical protein
MPADGDVRYWKATIRFSATRYVAGTDTGSFMHVSEVVPEPIPESSVNVDSVDVTGPATREDWEAWQVARQRGDPPDPKNDPVPDDVDWAEAGVVWVAHGSTDIVVAVPADRDPAMLDPYHVDDDFPTAYLSEEFAGDPEPHPGL